MHNALERDTDFLSTGVITFRAALKGLTQATTSIFYLQTKDHVIIMILTSLTRK